MARSKQQLIQTTQEKFGQFSNLLFPDLETLTNKQLEKLLSSNLIISETNNAFPLYSMSEKITKQTEKMNNKVTKQTEKMNNKVTAKDNQKTKLIKRQWLNNPSHCTFDFQTSKIDKDGEDVPSKPIQILTKLELDKDKGNLIFPFSIMTNKGQEKIGSVNITRDFLLDFNLIPTPIFKKKEWLTEYPEITNYEQLISHILINELDDHVYLHKSHIQDYRVILLSEFLKYLDNNQDLFSFDGYQQKQESLDDFAKLEIIENAYNQCTLILGESIESTMLDVLYKAYCLEA